MMMIRLVTSQDRSEWLRMREALWPSDAADRGDDGDFVAGADAVPGGHELLLDRDPWPFATA